MLKPLGILFIMNLYVGLLYQLKLFVFDWGSYFWKKRTLMFVCDLISQIC